MAEYLKRGTQLRCSIIRSIMPLARIIKTQLRCSIIRSIIPLARIILSEYAWKR